MSVGVNGVDRFTYVDELLRDLGGISPSRVRLTPTPGTATLRDLVRFQKKDGRVYELVDGTLVAKPVAFDESTLALRLGGILERFATDNDLGLVAGEQGLMRLMPGLARAPDVSFISWTQIPDRESPRAPVPDLYPDLAVEILSPSNTRGEMARKRKEYFLAGTGLVWQVNPRKRTVDVYTAPDEFTTLTQSDTLDGGDALPGFRLQIRDIFVNQPAADPKRKKRR
jgi:Uma2 family endonuclease